MPRPARNHTKLLPSRSDISSSSLVSHCFDGSTGICERQFDVYSATEFASIGAVEIARPVPQSLDAFRANLEFDRLVITIICKRHHRPDRRFESIFGLWE